MAPRTLSDRAGAVNLDPLRIDALRLKKAKRILGTASDAETINKALAVVISNDEMEAAIERAFGSPPLIAPR
jgi:hypothetical protein